jgi:Flp pilus assembly protein TadD
MVTGVRQLVGVLWPLALLVVFGAVFHGQARRSVAPDQVAECAASNAASLAVLEGCLAVQPDDIELMIGLGQQYGAAQRWADASRIYKRALSIDPDDGELHVLLGQTLLELHDVEGARAEGRRAVAIQPGNPAAVRLAGLQSPLPPQP